VSHHIIIPVAKTDWLLQNHRVHYQVAARKKKQIRHDAAIYARRDLSPCVGPVAIYARAYVRGGVLPDADAIAPMVKAAIDGLVDAGIIPNDDGENVYLVGYGRPARDRTLKPGMHALMLVVTDQYVPF
jgi:hypothetical protein